MEGLLRFSEQMPGVPNMTHAISSTLQMQILLLPFFSGEGTGSERFRHLHKDTQPEIVELGWNKGPLGLKTKIWEYYQFGGCGPYPETSSIS